MKRVWIFAAIIIVLLASAIWLRVQRMHQSQVPPKSNGFPLLVEASQKIIGPNPLFQPTPPTKEQLANFIAANREVLQTVRKALSMPCVIPTEEVINTFVNPLVSGPPPFYLTQLGQLLAAEGKLREVEGKFDEAGQSYFDAVRLGLRLQGGTIIHKSIAYAIVAIGQKPLFEITPHLSAQTSIHIANELLELVKSEEPVIAVFERERIVERRLWAQVIRELPEAFVKQPKETVESLKELPKVKQSLQQSRAEVEKIFLQRVKLRRTSLKLTAIELALHAFKQRENQLPQKLDELAPNYLKQIPTDEISGKSFVYRIDKSKHLVYSVGLNGKDEGGKGDDVTARLWEHLRSATFLKTYFGQP